MKVLLLKKNFKPYTDLKLIALAQNVLNSFLQPSAEKNELGGVFIPNLKPTHSEVESLYDAFNTAVLDYMNKGKVEKVVRDVKRLELENALKLWALQAEVFANGDVEILANTGFDMNKTPTPIPEPGVPVGFTVVSTNVGELTLTVKNVKGAKAFQFELNMLNDPNIMICTQGTAKCVMRNLQSGMHYVCKVAYITKNDTKIYAPAQTVVVS